MKIKLAKTAGFCMGVRRAMEMALAAANRGEGPITTYGPLIHNDQVMELLKSKGVEPVGDLSQVEEGTLIIRAHGIPPEERKRLRSLKNLRIIDATCPRVAKVQAIIRYHTNKGYSALIVGDRNHPEVIGLMGYGKGRAEVITDPDEISRIPKGEKLFVVAQTTQDKEKYGVIVDAIKTRFPDALVFHTICNATLERQGEVKSLTHQVNGVVVVGGYHSGNTQRLVQISKEAGLPTFHIETEQEIDRKALSNMDIVGVTAGASTPNWMIKNVVKEIEAIQSQRESRLKRWLRRAWKFFLLSNLIVALGAFALSYAATILAEEPFGFLYPLLAFFYIYAMRVLNRFLDKDSSTYNDPEQAGFYFKYKRWLIFSGSMAVVGVLVIAWTKGIAILLAMAGLVILGMIYSIPIIPVSKRHLGRYSKIKDIPGSKTLFEALAWGAVISLIPLLEMNGPRPGPALFSFLYVISMVYVRSALFDVFQVQGDLIVGKETLPITLGERRTLTFLKGIMMVEAGVLLVSGLVGLATPFSLMLLISLAALFVSLLCYERRWIHPGNRLEAIIEGNLFLAGLLGLFWTLGS